MQFSFAQELDRCQQLGGENVTDFLLEVCPLLRRYEQAKHITGRSHTIAHPARTAGLHQRTACESTALTTCYEVHQEFLRRFSPSQAVRLRSTGLPTTCDSCQARSTMVDDRSHAILVCTQCGVSQRYYFPKDGGLTYQQSRDRAPPAYQYQPLAYFRRCLEETQGEHRGRIPPQLVQTLREDFQQRDIPLHQVTPALTKNALQRNKKPQFYPCRWTITKLVNPHYTLIHIPQALMAQLLALFTGLMARYRDTVHKLRLQRKNLPSYPLLAQRFLQHLGHPDLAEAFGTLKSQKRHDLQMYLVNTILTSLK